MSTIDFTNLNNYKSSTGISRLFAEAIKQNVLSPNEVLSSKPESLIGMLISGITDLGAISFFEQSMYINEMNPSTAILTETMLANLLDSELSKIFAQPSAGLFFLAFPKKLLLESAIVDTSNPSGDIKRVRINKEARFFLLSGQSYTLDHSIDIYITKYDTSNPVFKANFDLSDKTDSGMTVISNSVLNVRPMVYEGVEYIAIYVPARNVFREYHNMIVNSTEISDGIYSFEKELMGFEVLYKENADAKFIKLNGYPEGRDNTDGYNYDITYDGDKNYIKIMFGKTSSSFKPQIRSEIKIVVYTTDGEFGNVNIPNIDENIENLSFQLQQDKNNKFEAALIGMKTLCSIAKTSTTGGKNQLTFEELRKYVINKGNSNKILSYADLDRKVKDYAGCNIEKIRHDLYMDIRVNTALKEKNGKDLIASGFGTVSFDFSDIKERIEIKSRIIKPTDVFRLDPSDYVYKYQKNPNPYATYIEEYKKNSATEISFPFFIKWENSNSLSTEVYDLAVNDIYFTSISFYDAISLDNINVNNISVYRNPSVEFSQSEREKAADIEGYYYIDFYSIVGDSVYEPIKEYFLKSQNGELTESDFPIINYRLAFTNKGIRQTYYADAEIIECDDKEKRLKLRAVLKTNNNINAEGGICFTDYSIIPIPIPAVPTRYYYLDSEVDMQIVVMFNNKKVGETRDVNYDKFMSESEKEIGYYVGIVYDLSNIRLGKNITSCFNFISDVKLKPLEYERYTEDQYETYTENVYEYDESGKIKMVSKEITLPDGDIFKTEMMSIIHKIGDFKYDDEGNKILKYKAGDIKLNENGIPIPKSTVSEMTGLIKNFTWYDRIYNVNTKYFDVRDAYYNNMNILEELQSVVLDGIRLSLGFKKTSGKSNLYKIKNLITGETEPLDNIAISLEIGVKFDSNMAESDQVYNVNLIIEKTKEYIYNVVDEFNVSNLITYLKDEIPSILHLEHYKLNNYSSNITQTIFRESNTSVTENEVLGIRSRINEETSDIDKKLVYFKPDIVVKLL